MVFSFNLFITQINSENARFRPLPPHLFEQLDGVQQKLEFLFEKHPNTKRRNRGFLRNAFLLNEQGVDYFGKKVPSLLLLLHQQVGDEKAPMTIFRKRFLFYGGSPIEQNGERHRLYLSQKFTFLSRGYLGFFLREFAQNLFISTFLVSFPLSFLMAWFFTRPIKKLQLAITELSSDLSNKKSLHKLTTRSDEFGDLAHDFEKMASHLEAIISSKNRLLSDVSHELRTPLARLQVAIGLANIKAPSDIHSELDRIKLEADRMNQMIAGILDYSKTDTQSAEPQLKPFNLSELLMTIVKDAQFEAQQQQLQIEHKLQPEVSIIADQDLLISGIENILRNALRYANKTIQVSCSQNHCEENTHDSSIEIIISDDGPGVESQSIEKIFEAFYRPQTDRSRDSGGVGLGLSIAQKAIEAHQGSIEAKNIKPNGLQITIKLPQKSLG